MPDAPLHIHREGDVTVVKITTGTLLDGPTIDQIGEKFDHVVGVQGRCRLLIDMSAVKFMSSTALGVFLKLRDQIEQAKGRFVFCGVHDSIMKSFHIAGLDKLFEFHTNSTRALNSFARK